MSVRYMFIARMAAFPAEGEDRVTVDAFHQVRCPVIEDETAQKVAQKIDPDLGKKDVQAFQAMEMRIRYNSDMWRSVLLVDSPAYIKREDLELLLNKLTPDELHEWLKSASI